MGMHRKSTAPVSLQNRSRLTNDPLRVRASGKTREGRRLRDLFKSYMAALGNPGDPVTSAAVLAAAELMVASEQARSKLLAFNGHAALERIDQVIRLENAAHRSVRRLGIKVGPALKPRQSLPEYLAGKGGV
jgi:hypothetical protein